MHLRLGQAARHDAQDQTSRHSQCRCRFHAQSDRLQSNPHSQTAGGVARVRSQREKLLPASEHTLTAQPSDPAKDGKCATFQILQQTAKPSDGLKAKFPEYDYADMVEGQYRLLSEGLGIKHVRLIIGNSMGGMNTWLWGEKHPGYMDALVPMASQPTAMASRNWMLRRMMLETIRNDPDYNNGNYATQPRFMKIASVFFGIATAGGTLNYQKLAPTREKADKLVDARLGAPMTADANDFLWQWASSADYDPAPGLEKIHASVVAINAADDERNPPETGLTERAMKHIKNGKLYLIPASEETSGHLTTGNAKFYKQQIQELLQMAPRQPM